MPDSIPPNSVGLVSPQTIHFDEPLHLEGGATLNEYDLILETYGQLNSDASNAILVCHALSGDHHAAGYHSMEDKKPGWWDTAIGPNKPFDSNKFFIVSLNNLGGCKGSTGPTSINPDTGKPYGPDFPIVTVKDWVKTQMRLMEKLEIKQWAAVIGGSLGGMQALRWSIDHPDKLQHAIAIAAAPKLSAQNIAFNEVARAAITSDPEFHNGYYHDHGVVPRRGLRLARMLGHITYLSDEIMATKFGRELSDGKLNYGYEAEFEVESYLRYQGESFVDRFDANSYLLMTKTLDYFDPAKDFNNDLTQTFKHVTCKFLIISFTSDWRFSPSRSREIVKPLLEAKKDVSYAEVKADQGHDAFLLENSQYMQILSNYMQRVGKN